MALRRFRGLQSVMRVSSYWRVSSVSKVSTVPSLWRFCEFGTPPSIPINNRSDCSDSSISMASSLILLERFEDIERC